MLPSIKELLNGNLLNMIIIDETNLDDRLHLERGMSRVKPIIFGQQTAWHTDETIWFIYVQIWHWTEKHKLECRYIRSIFAKINFKDKIDEISEKYDDVIIYY